MTDNNKQFIATVGNSENAYKASGGMVLLSLILGFVIGFIIWFVYDLSIFFTETLWGTIYSIADYSWIPLVVCPIGGLIIGLFTKYFGGAPEELEHILTNVKETGEYKLENPIASIIGFLLPIVFGGSIGPEAGLTGLIVAGCDKFAILLKKAGLRVVGLSEITVSAALTAIFATPVMGVVSSGMNTMNIDEVEGNDAKNYQYRKSVRYTLYIAAAIGSIGAILLLNQVWSLSQGIPKLEGINPEFVNLWWGIPCLILGYIAGFIYHVSKTFFKDLSNRMENKTIIKPVIAGIIIGALAIEFPLILFSGEAQSFTVMAEWQSMTVLILIGTGLLKCFATPLCLNLGWHGGKFFPCIFAGFLLGYGIALISGIDPMFCVAISTGTTLATIQRKPIIVMALLLLCFPLKSIIWMALACFIGAYAPIPKRFLKD